MKRAIEAVIVLSILLIVVSNLPKAFADISCQPIYGGGQSCITTNNISLNKKILNPQTNQFVDNLSINDAKYAPGFIATFQISVTNTGNNSIERVDVKDIFPQYVSFASGPGNFDSKNNTLNFNLTNLAPNETRKFGIVGRLANNDKIATNQGSIVCVVNQAIAQIDNSNVASDNSQFCIDKNLATKGGFPVFVSPKTGPAALSLLGLVPVVLAGWTLRKYSMKKEVIN